MLVLSSNSDNEMGCNPKGMHSKLFKLIFEIRCTLNFGNQTFHAAYSRNLELFELCNLVHQNSRACKPVTPRKSTNLL